VWATEHLCTPHAGTHGGRGKRINRRGLVVVALCACTLTSAQVPPRPNLDALPRPATQSSLDLEALARGYAAQTAPLAAARGLQRGPGLIVFISLTMPRPSLDRLLDQAARAGASVVLRGFAQGSLRRTVAEIQALIGQRALAVQIDPPAFDRFGITQVPSFVLVRDGARPADCSAGHCSAASDFLKTAGDVSLDYALRHMANAAPAFRDAVHPFLSRLQP
jgi:conjugal transfer pilus assembly protein TrbC